MRQGQTQEHGALRWPSQDGALNAFAELKIKQTECDYHPMHWGFLEDSCSRCHSPPDPLFTPSQPHRSYAGGSYLQALSYWELETRVNLVSPSSALQLQPKVLRVRG